MVSQVRSLGLHGVGGYEVSVECFMAIGIPAFDIVGLPDASVKEARERVRAAIKTAGLDFPIARLTVNLAPADRRKEGTLYDLPILLGILASTGEISEIPPDAAFLGELSLSGELRPIRGALPMALFAAKNGIRELYLPEENAGEAAFAQDITVYPVRDVAQLIAHLRGFEEIKAAPRPNLESYRHNLPDMADVKGQENVRRALEVAAAGGHNILLVGPPGSGKSMLAKRLPSILPDMSRKEMLEATEVHSVAGNTDRNMPVVVTRPFRSPHHTVSSVALSGGGSNPHPGEISLAHAGVLFLDELPEFSRETLEVLRQPLEDGEVTVSRVTGSYTFPSRFMLVCAMNPCKCGWYGHPSGRCRCKPEEVRRYHSRISGPLLDRIDIIVEVPSLEFDELKARPSGESSAEIKARVDAARAIQTERFAEDGISCNAYMTPSLLQKFARPDHSGELLLRRAFDTLALTARSYDRILRVARTIADLAGSENIEVSHIAEAIQYRSYDFTGGM